MWSATEDSKQQLGLLKPCKHCSHVVTYLANVYTDILLVIAVQSLMQRLIHRVAQVQRFGIPLTRICQSLDALERLKNCIMALLESTQKALLASKWQKVAGCKLPGQHLNGSGRLRLHCTGYCCVQ